MTECGWLLFKRRRKPLPYCDWWIGTMIMNLNGRWSSFAVMNWFRRTEYDLRCGVFLAFLLVCTTCFKLSSFLGDKVWLMIVMNDRCRLKMTCCSPFKRKRRISRKHLSILKHLPYIRNMETKPLDVIKNITCKPVLLWKAMTEWCCPCKINLQDNCLPPARFDMISEGKRSLVLIQLHPSWFGSDAA